MQRGNSETLSVLKGRVVIKGNAEIKWERWTCVITYWFEKIIDISTFLLYY